MSTKKTHRHYVDHYGDNAAPSSFEGCQSYISGIPRELATPPTNTTQKTDSGTTANHPTISDMLSQQQQARHEDCDELTKLRDALFLLIGELEEILDED